MLDKIIEALPPSESVGTPPDPETEVELRDLADRARETALGAKSIHTRVAYESSWRRFREWTSTRGLEALPAEPATIGFYVQALIDAGKAAATIQMARSAISAMHSTAGWAGPNNNPALHSMISDMLDSVARTAPPQKQAIPLTAEALAAIRATAHIPRRGRGGSLETVETAKHRGGMDLAIASVMRDGLLRLSEVASLTWGMVEIWLDGSGRVRFTRRKKRINADSVAYLSVSTARALRAIRPSNPSAEALIFNLSTAQIRRRLHDVGQAAGVEGLSGHSARVGMAQDLAAHGTELPALMQAGGWDTAKMVANYTRNQDAGRGAVAKYYAARQ